MPKLQFVMVARCDCFITVNVFRSNQTQEHNRTLPFRKFVKVLFKNKLLRKKVAENGPWQLMDTSQTTQQWSKSERKSQVIINSNQRLCNIFKIIRSLHGTIYVFYIPSILGLPLSILEFLPL